MGWNYVKGAIFDVPVMAAPPLGGDEMPAMPMRWSLLCTGQDDMTYS